MIEEIRIASTEREEIIDITHQVKDAVKRSGVTDGICVVFALHATAAITVLENHDPNICHDFLDCLSGHVPSGKWRHDQVDGNGDSHIKAGLVGPSETFIIRAGKIALGTWQSVVACEFDGPRSDRTIIVKVG
ncbi:MAG: secondary thiamine-phosphate synthase enzyme YjbQ [archaeon]